MNAWSFTLYLLLCLYDVHTCRDNFTLEKIILILVRTFFVNHLYLHVAVLKSENAILVKNSLPSAFLFESVLHCITIN